MAKQRKQDVYYPPLLSMAFVLFHSATIGAKQPYPLHEFCFTSDPPTLRGNIRGLVFMIAITPFIILWSLIQVAVGFASLLFIAAIVL